jgi:hypothetical protein
MELTYDLSYRYYKAEGHTTHRAEQIGEMYYRYDGNGNITEERKGGHGETAAGDVPYRYENGIYSSDYAFGLTKPGSGGNAVEAPYQRTYTWDYRNQLVRTKDNQYTVHYRYGADGQRAVKYTEETREETLYYNNMWQMRMTSGSQQWLQSKHIFLGESRIATKSNYEEKDGESTEQNIGFESIHQYWYHGDHLGSAQTVTNFGGKLHERIEYTPYIEPCRMAGQMIFPCNATPAGGDGELWIEHKYEADEGALPYRFTGKELDSETGFYSCRGV